MYRPPFICASCVHLDTDTLSDPDLRVRCAAYLDGVPAEILAGRDHRSERGDEDEPLTYEMAPGMDAAFSAWRNSEQYRPDTGPIDSERENLTWEAPEGTGKMTPERAAERRQELRQA